MLCDMGHFHFSFLPVKLTQKSGIGGDSCRHKRAEQNIQRDADGA
jgi:hypothetical protein